MALPVELKAFYAEAVGEKVNLYWQTSAEVNSDYFEVEKSADLNRWSSIDRVAANQNAAVALDYTSVDLHPVNGPNYYRLKQVDQDGSFTYSKVVTAYFKKEGFQMKVFPNPFRNQITLSLNTETRRNLQLKVFNAVGQQMHSANIRLERGTAASRIATDNWGEGIYYLNVWDENGRLLFQETLIH